MTTYNIKRMYADRFRESRITRTGLTLEEAKEHCRSNDTHHTLAAHEAEEEPCVKGPWFDGYNEE